MNSFEWSVSANEVEVHDYAEVMLHVAQPRAANPFCDAHLTARVWGEGEGVRIVNGFCDSPDGSLYRLRMMPVKPGTFRLTLLYRDGDVSAAHEVQIRAVASSRKGVVRQDPDHPWHFIWSGSGEHYFYNGTTAYFMAGWKHESSLVAALDRLASHKVNRVRCALAGRIRNAGAWAEPTTPTERFTFCLNPWQARRPDSVEDPGFDMTRFNVEFWRHYEALLRLARERDIVVSVVFYLDGYRPGVEPFGTADAGGAWEQRYYQYAAARFGAFSNVMWDITNEWRLLRTENWVRATGRLLREADPYDHMMSCHGHGSFTFGAEPWANFAMYQAWDELGGHGYMLHNRQQAERAGRPIPQVNEEYGYQDHYPAWGAGHPFPARNADNRSRIAWSIAFAGGYQTTGERANAGDGTSAPTPVDLGGWVNGYGNDDTLIGYHQHLATFFEAFDYWTCEPRQDLATHGVYCLARPGHTYAFYFPRQAKAYLATNGHGMKIRWFNCATGEWHDGQPVTTQWQTPDGDPEADWALLLTEA